MPKGFLLNLLKARELFQLPAGARLVPVWLFLFAFLLAFLLGFLLVFLLDFFLVSSPRESRDVTHPLLSCRRMQ